MSVLDKLGIALKSRAKGQRQMFDDAEGADYQQRIAAAPDMGLYGPLRTSRGTQLSSVLPSSMWDGLRQALFEAGVDRVADNSVGVRRGMFPPDQRATIAPDDVDTLATGTGQNYLSHEQWMGRRGKR